LLGRLIGELGGGMARTGRWLSSRVGRTTLRGHRREARLGVPALCLRAPNRVHFVDAATIAELGTAAGTLILAVATFASVRSANKAARVAEQSLLEGLRPLLVTSRLNDPSEKISFADQHWIHLGGGRAIAEAADGVIYLAIALRNVGRGMAVLDRWNATPGVMAAIEQVHLPESRPIPDPQPEEFRRLTRDIYVPAGDFGFWQGALRDPNDRLFEQIGQSISKQEAFTVDLLYGDYEGGQRVVSRFTLIPRTAEEDGRVTWLPTVSRHWNLDRPSPR
jgi:hypothetical protein